jgi:hydrogenase-1 operon protein HyaF
VIDVETRVGPLRTHDLIEVGDVPYLVRMPASTEPDPLAKLTRVRAADDVMNAMPIITEVREHGAGFPLTKGPHSINLTLLPLSKEDIAFLEEVLGHGPIDVLSRGYGDCRVASTAIPNVWWVRYYNSMGTLILNTLEVIDVPGVACAALEDIRDSSDRLDEILEPYWADME